jgi:hypothetical protein
MRGRKQKMNEEETREKRRERKKYRECGKRG